MNIRTHLIRLAVVTTTSVFLVAACGGRRPDPVAAYKIGDNNLSCDGIRAEQSFINQQVATLIPESKKTGKNVALATAGVFLIVPFFFMDVSDAERVDIEAYQKRYQALDEIAIQKGCDKPSVVLTADSASPANSSSQTVAAEGAAAEISKKLVVLDQLQKSGAITDEEYKKQRAETIAAL